MKPFNLDYSFPIKTLDEQINKYIDEAREKICKTEEAWLLIEKYEQKDWKFFKKLYKLLKRKKYGQ